MLELTEGEEVILGGFLMDPKAPVDIMREYTRRYFFKQLNDSVGESFSFMMIKKGKKEILTRKKELRVYSKDYLVFKMDHKTMEGALTAVIIPEKGKERVIIPNLEIPPEHAETDKDAK